MGSTTCRRPTELFFEGSTALLGAKELGKTKAPPKVKFFMWLVLHRRIWTANRRLRHGLQDSDDCNLCSQASETCDHLFVGCDGLSPPSANGFIVRSIDHSCPLNEIRAYMPAREKKYEILTTVNNKTISPPL